MHKKTIQFLLLFGVISSILSTMLAWMFIQFYGYIRGLDMAGALISFVGALFMLFTPLDSFIAIRQRDDSSSKGDSFVTIGNDESEFEARFEAPSYPYFRMAINKIGLFLLSLGFIIQFVSIYLDP